MENIAMDVGQATFEVVCPLNTPDVGISNDLPIARPLTDADLDDFAEKRHPQNTINKQKWAMSLFDNWLTQRNANVDPSVHVRHIMDDVSEEEMSNTLAKFIKEVQPKRSSKPFSGKLKLWNYIAVSFSCKMHEAILERIVEK